MTIEFMHDILRWATLINIIALIFWLVMFRCAHNLIYRVHGQWFKISEEQFDAIHYAGMAFYKLLIFIFNLVPLLAFYIVL